jgi:hypothetical protein
MDTTFLAHLQRSIFDLEMTRGQTQCDSVSVVPPLVVRRGQEASTGRCARAGEAARGDLVLDQALDKGHDAPVDLEGK